MGVAAGEPTLNLGTRIGSNGDLAAQCGLELVEARAGDLGVGHVELGEFGQNGQVHQALVPDRRARERQSHQALLLRELSQAGIGYLAPRQRERLQRQMRKMVQPGVGHRFAIQAQVA